MPPMVVVDTEMVVPVDSFGAVVVIGPSLVLLSVVCSDVPCVEVGRFSEVVTDVG